MSELAKYEAELTAINQRLAQLNDERTKLLQHGFRIEGVVAYLRGQTKGADTSEHGSHEVQEPAVPAGN